MKRPIKPEEITNAKTNSIPGEVFEIFNALITEEWDGREAVVWKNEAVKRIIAVMNCSRETVFNAGWLEVEESYRAEGWTVEYDKPGYCESYDASYTFRK